MTTRHNKMMSTTLEDTLSLIGGRLFPAVLLPTAPIPLQWAYDAASEDEEPPSLDDDFVPSEIPLALLASKVDDYVVDRISGLVEDDIRSERRLLGLTKWWQKWFLSPPIRRSMEIKRREAFYIYRAMGCPAKGTTVLVDEAYVKEVMPVFHVGVCDYLSQFNCKPTRGAVTEGEFRCKPYVQLNRTIALVEAVGCIPSRNRVTASR